MMGEHFFLPRLQPATRYMYSNTGSFPPTPHFVISYGWSYPFFNLWLTSMLKECVTRDNATHFSGVSLLLADRVGCDRGGDPEIFLASEGVCRRDVEVPVFFLFLTQVGYVASCLFSVVAHEAPSAQRRGWGWVGLEYA